MNDNDYLTQEMETETITFTSCNNNIVSEVSDLLQQTLTLSYTCTLYQAAKLVYYYNAKQYLTFENNGLAQKSCFHLHLPSVHISKEFLAIAEMFATNHLYLALVKSCLC